MVRLAVLVGTPFASLILTAAWQTRTSKQANRLAQSQDDPKTGFRRNSTVYQKCDIPTRINPFLRSSGQPIAELRSLSLAAIVLATLSVSTFAPPTASAQPAEASHPPGHRVAVIDVGYIFKNLPAIKAEVSKVQSDLKNYEKEFKQKRDEMMQAVTELKKMKVGTPEYARQEEHVANLDSKLRLETRHKHHEFGSAEAKVYYDSYQRIATAVKAIATHNNINLVLRFDSADMDLEQSDSVARGIMRNVVFHDRSIDITDTVMQYLEQQTKVSQAKGGNAASATNR
jgi:Skp family chaperone for outer membrane proteins